MSKPKMSDVELLSCVEWLRQVSPEEQEAGLWDFAEEFGAENADRAKVLLHEPKPAQPKPPEPAPEEEPKRAAVHPHAKWMRARAAAKAKAAAEKSVVVQLRPVEQAKPEPEPEPEPETEPEPEPEPKEELAEEEPPEEEPTEELEVVRLDLDAPYDVARTFIRMAKDKSGDKRYAFVGNVEGELVKRPTLWHWKGDYKCWDGRLYEDVEDEQIKAQMYDFLDRSMDLACNRIKPRQKSVNEILDALRAGINLPSKEAPCWIDVEDRPEAQGLLVCNNGLLDLETGRLWDHDPRFFSLNCVDFDYDPRAQAPRWDQFLHEVWDKDYETIGCLQEFFGLWLTDVTKHEKGCGIFGPPRSGKGTIGRLLKGLLGSTSYISTSLQTLGDDFGMESLIGKKLALIPDVKLDGRANVTRIMERLLTIIGEDDQDINRKNQKHWLGHLTVRFLILGNDVPKFRGSDEAGGFTKRMIMLQMKNDFYGREDFDLTDKLLAERAGILNWAMEGWRRLKARDRFIQPASGLELVQKLRAATSTIGAFALECCVLGPHEKVTCEALWLAFCEWAEHRGIAITHSTQTFSGALHDVFPGVITARPRKDNDDERSRFQCGIRLKNPWRTWYR